MLHTVEQLIARINVMHDKAIELHRVRNEFSEISGKTYDHVRAKALVEEYTRTCLWNCKRQRGQRNSNGNGIQKVNERQKQ